MADSSVFKIKEPRVDNYQVWKYKLELLLIKEEGKHEQGSTRSTI